MKKMSMMSISILSLVASLTAGCASYPTSINDIFGVSHADLKKARDRGITREFALSQEEAFGKILKILEDNKLTIYRKSPEKDYIIVMGFEKQTDTTRVGIFFEAREKGKTGITLSCLSRSALGKAETIIFGGLEK